MFNGRKCVNKVNFYKINAHEPAELAHQLTVPGPSGAILHNVLKAVEEDFRQEAE